MVIYGSFSVITAHATKHGYECPGINSEITVNGEKEQLLELAFILSGRHVQLKYFKELDLTRAKRVRFVSSLIASDLYYEDKIVDPCSFSVERRNYDFGGRLSNIENIPLKETDFFSRLSYVKNYIDKNGKLPDSPIDLMKIEKR